MTQVLARTTTLLDGRKTVKMTGRVYLRAILPIGIFFSLSLICGNLTYLYLSVAFIQMLKVRGLSRSGVSRAHNSCVGHHPCRCITGRVCSRGLTAQRQGPVQCFLHCHRGHTCISGRDQIRTYRIHLSSLRDHV